MQTDEEWRAVPGFEGRYEVSSNGQVRSLDRVTVGRRCARKFSGQVLRPDTARGRWSVTLCRDGKLVRESIHRIVAAAFIGPCPEGLWVDHINQDPTDNRACNLRYATPSENRLNTSYMRAASGVRHVHWNPAKSNYKNPWQARVGRKFLGQFPTIEAAAEAVGRYNRPKAIQL